VISLAFDIQWSKCLAVVYFLEQEFDYVFIRRLIPMCLCGSVLLRVRISPGGKVAASETYVLEFMLASTKSEFIGPGETSCCLRPEQTNTALMRVPIDEARDSFL
jgi:hypothetical protein